MMPDPSLASKLVFFVIFCISFTHRLSRSYYISIIQNPSLCTSQTRSPHDLFTETMHTLDGAEYDQITTSLAFIVRHLFAFKYSVLL